MASLEPRRACQVLTENEVGSGYLVSGDLILTARHVVLNAKEITARFIDDRGRPRDVLGHLAWADEDGEGLDLVVVRITEVQSVVPVRYGRLPARMKCEAIGFPLFKERKPAPEIFYREAHHMVGMITPDANQRSGTYEVTVDEPAPNLFESPWAGMSGAAIFVGGLVVGIVSEHHSDEGLNHLAASPIDHWRRLDDQPRLAQLSEILGPTLARPLTPVVPPIPPTHIRPQQLPVRRQFVGRVTELDHLLDLLAPDETRAQTPSPRIGIIVGLPGVGKTELATQAGHASMERGWFAGGQLFLDLRGYDAEPLSAYVALGHLLRDLGIPAREIPEDEDARGRQLRSTLAQHEEPLLIVLDNASRASQVEPLLPSSGPHRVLVTSRHHLPQLEARLLRLPVLSAAESVTLMDSVLRTRSGDDTTILDHPQAAAEVAQLCGHLPLALRVVTARLATSSLDDLAAELREQGTGMEGLSDGEKAVRPAFDLSYRHLAADEAMLFRQLSLNGSPHISLAAAAAVAGTPKHAARRLLDRLVEANLIERISDRPRWTMHDLLWEYAAVKVGEDPEHSREAARRRLAEHYNQGLALATAILRPSAGTGVPDTPKDEIAASAQFATAEDAADWLGIELVNLMADEPQRCFPLNELAKTLAAAGRESDAWHVWRHMSSGKAKRLDGYPEYITDPYPGNFTAVRQLAEIDLQLEELNAARKAVRQAQQSTDRRGEADALLRQAKALLKHYMDVPKATNLARQAVDVFDELRDTAGRARAYCVLGGAYEKAHRSDEALTAYQTAERLAGSARVDEIQAQALERIGRLLLEAGRHSEGIESLRSSVKLFHRLEDAFGGGRALSTLGGALLELGRYDDAIETCREAIALCSSANELYGRMSAQMSLSTALCEAGRYQEAIPEGERTLAMCQEANYPEGESKALLELGFACMHEGLFEESVKWHEQALPLLARAGEQQGEAWALLRLGIGLSNLRNWDEANRAYERARKKGDASVAGRAWALLGGNLVDSGYPEQALPYLYQAFEEAQEIGDADLLKLTARNIGIAQRKLR
ncbi:tetratricopeptide repeat protein [Catenulispora rubra]|uniref:tetratricopeptide repeat protein n=1 Tax=Catenulispora rubra TaxID=280293 RepID=UPI001891F938|nr:tetratricopeptide repeat protein [Catenulispora rubra]